jgi:hypothetical protein
MRKLPGQSTALRPAHTGVFGDGNLRVRNNRTKTAAVIGTGGISHSADLRLWLDLQLIQKHHRQLL